MTKQKIAPRLFKGARDFLPEQMIHRERILETMRTVFRKYGFEPLETPAIEYLEVLSGKYGEDADRLIYRLNYKPGTKDEAALHYDLTVPLSRVIAMHPHLPKPFKRYQIQPVWRADRPQPRQGRFREFYQCDIDAIGHQSMILDAEIIAVCYEVLTSLDFDDFMIRINNRKILNGLVQYIGLDPSYTQEVCRSIDKLDKISFEEVAKELRGKGFPDSAIAKLGDIINLELDSERIFSQLGRLFEGIAMAEEGLQETEVLFNHLKVMGVSTKHFRFDSSLARGLDYYTGPIFETVLPNHPHMGSLTGGGRYDELIGMFSGVDVPAVGTSLGLDRIFTAMQQLGMLEEMATRTKALVVNFGDTEVEGVKVAALLRQHSIPTEVYPVAAKLKKQFSYANQKGIPFVLILGAEEVEKGVVTVKDMQRGTQEMVKREELVDAVCK